MRIWLVCVCALVWAGSAFAAPIKTKGRVAEVTLYRGQAEVVRHINVTEASGTMAIVVTDLPDRIIGNSLFADGNNGLQVRAVRYRVRHVRKAPRKDVRKFDEHIEGAKETYIEQGQALAILAKQLEHLGRLEKSFIMPRLKVELIKGTLQPKKLAELTNFLFAQRLSLTMKRNKVKKARRILRKKLRVLKQQRRQLTQVNSHYAREAVVFLEKKTKGASLLRLTYRVKGCNWSPAYNLRGSMKNKKVILEYNAIIRQMSGENWDGVKLKLSTASPALNAAGPGLAPFKLALHSIRRQRVRKRRPSNLHIYRSIQRRRRWAHKNTVKAINQSATKGLSWKLNRSASEEQLLELILAGGVMKSLRSQPDREGPNLTYTISEHLSLGSRSDRQMIRIAHTELNSRFYYVASPILTQFVYREAEIKNNSGKDLLKGPVTVYLDNRFVGRTELATVAQEQTFVVGFGAAPRLRAHRILTKRSETTQGGNKVITLSYRIKIDNFKGSALQMRVQDRIPNVKSNNNDIQLQLNLTTTPMSTDKRYLRIERPNGILRWDIKVPAQASGEKAKIIEYGYTLSYDKNFKLKNPHGRAERRHFFKLFRLRNNF